MADDDLFDLPEGTPFDPFATETALGIDRDRWDRPLIKPDPEWTGNPYARPTADGAVGHEGRHGAGLATLGRATAYNEKISASNGWPDGQVERWQLADGRRPYSRMSSLVKGLDPGYGLVVWKLRHAALSIARRPDLQDLLCGLTYADGKAIDGIVEEALVRAKDDGTDPEHKLTAAHRGTAFHAFTTPGAPAIDPVYGPRLADYDVSAKRFAAALEESGLEIVDSEQFVVADHLRAAGTYDHLVRDRLTGRTHVLDVKTGSMQWLSFICQVEGYSKAKRYDPATGARSPLHPDLDASTGFIAATDLSTGDCLITPIDLTGELAELAVDVYRANQSDQVKRLVGAPRNPQPKKAKAKRGA